MAGSYTVSGVEYDIAATDLSDIATKLASARSGARIIQTEPGAPGTLNLTVSKPGKGVDIVFHPGQTLKLTGGEAGCNVKLWGNGALLSADAVNGESESVTSGANSVNLTNGSGVGLYGFRVGMGSIGIVLNNCTDIELRGLTYAGTRDDFIRLNGTNRVLIDGIYARSAESYAFTFSWKTDGSQPPQYGLTSAQASALGLNWSDGSHYDLLQVQASTIASNTTIRNLNCEMIGGGIGSYSSEFQKALFENNRIGLAELYHTIYVRGGDIEVRGNQLGRLSPSSLEGQNVTLWMERTADGALRAGLNSAFGGVNITNGGGNGLNLTGAMNGDTVAAPDLPNLLHRPDMTDYSAPSWTPLAAPVMDTMPRPYWGSVECWTIAGAQTVADPTTSQVLSARPGKTRGWRADGGYECRWYSNGVLIEGANTRTLALTGRSGQSIEPEMRFVWPDETASAWKRGKAVTVA